jgi:uncharacterized protein (TIGR02246 family)
MRDVLTKSSLAWGLFFIVICAAFVQAQEEQKSTQNASSSTLLEEARSAIEKGNRQWIEGWEKGDAALVAEIFTEDGMWLGPNGKTYKGRRQILERLKAGIQFLGAGVKITVTTTALWVDGETAYETGKYVYKYQENGKPAIDEGRYATVWKRQTDGVWKLQLDMMVP